MPLMKYFGFVGSALLMFLPWIELVSPASRIGAHWG